jgi:hypothetical protein
MRMLALFFPTLVGIGFLAHSAFAETCTSPDDPSCTITCDDGCLWDWRQGMYHPVLQRRCRAAVESSYGERICRYQEVTY